MIHKLREELYPMETKIRDWVEKASESTFQTSKHYFPDVQQNHVRLKVTKGQKYFKVISYCPNPHRTRGIYCFIDFEGNIYKSKGPSGPSKGIRGHIDTKDPATVTNSTSWLYRG